ncbi:MAG: biosynthetic-type acetolactate synthase large subunit [Verrucomicrobiae bacterium]|nr:biosynthetic-type acetolactate synthase large subunit [Verrucomicrobiae bacterium]
MSQSTTTSSAHPVTSGAAAPHEVGPLKPGRDIFVEALERAGVEVIFAYPGGASMEIHQSLTRSKIRTILPRHEQGGSFAAEGYARATGKAGVCMGTSGPGATNLVTAIADAYMDSCPLVAITGQVTQSMIGRGAFQETDMVGVTLPIVKHSYLITDIKDIPRVVAEAFYIAETGRPGPVVIDFPKNLQQAKAQPVWPTPEEIRRGLRGYNPNITAGDLELNEIIGLIEKADRPVIYCGGGIITSGAAAELRKFAETTRIPVTTTLMGIGGFPETHPLSLRWLGMHGSAVANWAVSGEFEPRTDPSQPMVRIHEGADVLLALGVRFDDRVTGAFSEFAKHATIVHVDLDASEHNKNKRVQLAVHGDIRDALSRLNALIARRGGIRKTYPGWHRQIEAWKAKASFHYEVTPEIAGSDHMKDHLRGQEDQVILPQMVIEMLYEMTGGDAIITTGVGQHQMWSGQWFKYDEPRTFITSGGLGSMGYGYPAALGAKVARPDKQVIDIDGDGSFLMNIQELATAHVEKIAAKAIILNNQHLGMVVQWEDNFYAGNRGHTYLGDPGNRAQVYPDFVRVANSFNVPAEQVMFRRDLRAALQRMLDASTPYVLNVMTPYSEHVLPFIPAGRTVADMKW